jgi:hypothetical protein
LAEEFIIKSPSIEDKVNQLLPSQGGFQAGVDFSASTMVVPIIDLTETAEGGTTRVDLQSSFSLTSSTSFSLTNVSTTIINTTGYFRIFGRSGYQWNNGNGTSFINITDGTTTKSLYLIDPISYSGSSDNFMIDPFDFIVLLQAGDSIVAGTTNAQTRITGVTRQIANLQGVLTNP